MKMNVESLLKKYEGNVILIDKRLKVLSSNKCNLKKKKDFINEKEYNEELKKIVFEYDLLKECKELCNGKKVINYLDMNESEIMELSYDSIEKGIRSLSSIKSRNNFNDVLVSEIEEKSLIFKKYKEEKKFENNGLVRKEEIFKVISLVEEREDKEINKEFVLRILNNLI